MQHIKTSGVPIYSWCDNLEPQTLQQAENLAKLPFAFSHVCLMPDAHQGFGMPIGGVLATKDYIIPNAVGVDIGCGVCVLPTAVSRPGRETLQRIMDAAATIIPTGFKKRTNKVSSWLMPGLDKSLTYPVVDVLYEEARYQLGTLGGGNHFIELQVDEQDHVWIMIHSGSRHLGKCVADYYNEKAKSLNARWLSMAVPDLAFLPADSSEGQNYLTEMRYCTEYAATNRKTMMHQMAEILMNEANVYVPLGGLRDVAHNYVELETHQGHEVWVHRKGATRALQSDVCIIPGSQGSSSYVGNGLGNPSSFRSCSHGAGRKLGRKQAQRELSLEGERDKLDQLGVLHSLHTEEGLDEAPGAYKDIDEVMAAQVHLVEVSFKLKPIAVLKG